jgi:hypothetical protein
MPALTQYPAEIQIPLSDVSRTPPAASNGSWRKNEDEKTPVFHFNNLTVYICGEHSFGRIAEDIQAAEQSVDLAFWGFDPAMELTRNSGEWPRGDTWGDLLRDADTRSTREQEEDPGAPAGVAGHVRKAMAGNCRATKKKPVTSAMFPRWIRRHRGLQPTFRLTGISILARAAVGPP